MLWSGNGRAHFRGAPFVFTTLLMCACAAFGASKIKREGTPTPTPVPGDLTNIPLPVGHEAKGLVLPNYDSDGHLIARLEAGSAKRIDIGHMLFNSLKLTTFTPEQQPDMRIEMIESVLDLKTRIVSSEHRSTIQRADFNISGDKVEFDTIQRHGTLTGNVKMVITGKDKFRPQDETAKD